MNNRQIPSHDSVGAIAVWRIDAMLGAPASICKRSPVTRWYSTWINLTASLFYIFHSPLPMPMSRLLTSGLKLIVVGD